MKILCILLFSLNLIAYESSEEIIASEDFQVKLQSYSPKATTKKNTILLIIPPTGGMNFIDKSYARKFARQGIETKILKHWSNDDEYNVELSIHTRFYSRAQNAIDLIMDKYPDHNFWVLGTSVGGLHGTIATARHSRITKALFIVSGADIADIILNSNQEVLVEAKKIRFKKFKYKDDQEYLENLRKVIPFEVQNLPTPQKTKVGLIISTNDETVPTKNQLLLESLWNTSRVSTLRLGHTSSVVFSWMFKSSKIKIFFLND